MFSLSNGVKSCLTIFYRGTKSLEDLSLHLGGKEAFKKIFTILTPNNEFNFLLGLGAALSSFHGRIIRSIHGNTPVIALISEGKGLGKTTVMQSLMWATSRIHQIYNNPSRYK